MNTNVKDYYELLTFGLGGITFQEFVDRFKEKYNTLQADGFNWDPEIQLDYTYSQLIASLNIATLPNYVDSESPAFDKSLGEFKIGQDEIPTQKSRYALNRKMLRERMLMVQEFGKSAMTQGTQNTLLDLLFESTDKLLAGHVNARTHQRMQIVSKGQFTIDLTNNPRGLKGLTFDFGIPAANKKTLAAGDRWWTTDEHIQANEGAGSDPIEFLKKERKRMRKAGFPAGHFEMSADLFDDLLGHSKVLKRIGLAMTPLATDASAITAASNLPDAALRSQIEKIVGCPIIPRDSLAAVEKFDDATKSIKTSTIENFEPKNVAFVPDGQIGTIKAVRPLVFSEDPTQRVAWFDGGRTLITQRFNAETKTMYVESESAFLCVPNTPQYMCVYTVTA